MKNKRKSHPIAKSIEIPLWLLNKSKLNLSEACVYMLLFDLIDKDWTYQDVADALNITKRTVCRVMKRLEEKKYINVIQTADAVGKRNVIIPIL